MNSQRPFEKLGVSDLRELAKKQWFNQFSLRDIERELSFRSTPIATKLHIEVQDRLADLANGHATQHSQQRPFSGSSTNYAQEQSSKGNPQTEASRLRAELAAVELKAARLERELSQARSRIEALEAEADRRPGGNPLFRRVGLDESCPDFVVKAVRTAYRKQLHPDARPSNQKTEAERRFKDAEVVFDEIYWLRGL
ncbi:MAG TPA: hypothetical protein VF744_11870 [Beijerinckiaceae bacterium]|jgi:hypothetical protein